MQNEDFEKNRAMALEASIIPGAAPPYPAARGARQKREDFPLSSTLQSAGLRPVVVDLEGALIACDTLYEQCLRAAARQPLRAIKALSQLGQGLTAVKEAMASVARPGAFAFREDVVAWLRAEAAYGRPIHLVTAADQTVADAVAHELQLFDSAASYSHGDINCEADRLAWLNERFPSGFDYLGDGTSDPEPLRGARLIHVDCDGGRQHAGIEQSDIRRGRAFVRRRPTPRDWLDALRVHQWSKNLLLFVPLILSRSFADPAAVLKVVYAFFIFSAVVSATYILNDLLDVDSDRRHPKKRERPLAAGRISARAASSAAALLLIVGFAAGAALGPAFAALLFLYLATTVAYSLSIKRIPFADVLTIAILFSVRVGAGAVAIPVFVSPWLFSFSLLFFLSLALSKRHVELIRATGKNDYTLDGRGYRPNDWPLTLAIGVASALASVVVMLIYIQEAASSVGGFHDPDFLYPIAAAILLWVMRLWMLSHRGELDDDPIVFALKDRFSIALAGICVALLALAM